MQRNAQQPSVNEPLEICTYFTNHLSWYKAHSDKLRKTHQPGLFLTHVKNAAS